MRAVRFVGKDGCTDVAYTDALAGTPGGVIDTLPGGNVTLCFKRDKRPLLVNMAQLLRDLVDVAVMAYIADEMEKRECAPDRWTRSQEFVVPVRDPVLWSRVAPVLAKTLNRVAGDNFSFHWLQRAAVPIRRHRLRLPLGTDAVCLFSGGIDSLLGAYHLLKSGKKLILLGHQADSVTASAQTALAGQLALLFPRQLTLVQCRAARSQIEQNRYALAKKVEETHRCRSFLFLSLAAAVAATAGVAEICIPENGLIALNAPLQRSRFGSLSTRTAHPQFLAGFADLVSQLGVFTGAIRNPFLYQSKTDMLRGLPADMVPLVKRSVSCSRSSRYKNFKVLHCGHCVPCIYRRTAMIECGLDDAKDYAFDVFQDLGNIKDYQRVGFRALVQFAETAAVASDMALDMTVLSHGYFSPEVGALLGPYATTDYSPWTTMIRSWSKDFLRKVQTACSAETLRIVGRSSTKIKVPAP
jgi:7-cyano-7-deazaguanine synthase in queuosine biosynthesis